ncbi:SDR family oxidoreductase [bacterium]|jgi:NAD(P)-dependent dehydrogenase (short-subunit alcohol dehydrogenase family)|nr:SDR family oxidoreductase [bacterium]
MSSYVEKLFSLNGKVALITGGSKGIGAEIAFSLLKSGANIVCVSRSKNTIKKELKDYYMQCDISDTVQFNKVCKYVNELYGGIDILVNAAGITLKSDDSSDKFDVFNKTLNVNLTSVYQCCELASNFMKNGGSIINITSIGSMLGFPSNPSYVASKGGVRMLTKALAEDFSSRGIRVNNIVPGYILTDMTKSSFNDKKLNRERVDRMMIKRWGDVKDISGAAVFLASGASSYVTGIDLVVDGGWTSKGI